MGTFLLKILWPTLKELALGMLAKIAFKTIFERFATRATIHGLEYLRNQSTNELWGDTFDDIIKSLKGKKLKVADDYGTDRKL